MVSVLVVANAGGGVTIAMWCIQSFGNPLVESLRGFVIFENPLMNN
jgi:hypothetical protein